jgi:hypothetical protein
LYISKAKDSAVIKKETLDCLGEKSPMLMRERGYVYMLENVKNPAK